MAETKKIKFIVGRGNPCGGPVIRAGTAIDFPKFWADRFIADGTAVEVAEEKSEPKAADRPAKKSKK